MKILAIETSGSICGVSLLISGKIVTDNNNYQTNTHDRLLGEYIRRILKDNKVSASDLDYVAVSAGPGSFTGLRIGGAFAKSLCFGGNTRIIPVPTLDAMANYAISLGNSNYNKICVANRSHKDWIYSKILYIDGTCARELVFDTMGNLEMELDADTMLCGSAFAGQSKNAIFIEGPTAMMVATKAYLLAQDGVSVHPYDYEPIYIQEFEPKIIFK